MNTNNKKKESNLIAKWLKRMFSLEFLGVLIGLAGLWFGYKTFIQEKPGILRLTTKSGKLDEKVNTVFYGFELDKDSFLIMDLPNIPILANMTSNTIEDITVFGYTPKEYKALPNSRYMAESIEAHNQNNKEFGLGKLSYALRQDKINPMDGIFWPVSIIYPNQNELFFYPIEIYYSFKTKEMTHITLFLVGIPINNGKLSSAEVETEFIKKIKPYLLGIDDVDKTAIIYHDKIVPSPSIKKLKQDNVVISNILELK